MVDNVKIPKVSVVMPVYNCELYIEEAIDSILNQTFSDFEFIIIDDASTDKTVAIIKSYNDVRIKLVEKPLNTGLTNSLNFGLSIAKGEYIARMDGDDISLPHRFEKQVAFLDDNKDVVLCGTNFSVIGTERKTLLPQDNESIKLALLNGNCIAHPSVMIKKEALNRLPVIYDVSKETAEDFDLWVRLAAIGKLHNLQEVLLNYRVHNTQVSQQRQTWQIQIALECRFLMFKYLDYNFDLEDSNLLKKIIVGSSVFSFDEINKFFYLKEKMILANSNDFFNSKGLKHYLYTLHKSCLKKYFLEREKFNPLLCFQYITSRNKFEFKLRLKDEIKLVIKSIIYFKRK